MFSSAFKIKTVFLLSLFVLISTSVYAAKGKHAMVVTADARATAAANEVLLNGGNAVDAAVAAQWVLNVVEPQSSGIGGGGFFLFYEAQTKRIYAFDGREKAPGEANAQMFYDEFGDVYPFSPERISGGLPVGVPGTLRLMHDVHQRFSSKQFTFSDLFDPAIYFAERGIQVSPRLAYHIDQEAERLRMFKASKSIFLDEEGNAPKPGTILFQPDLAKTFRTIQREGISVFYEGPIAEAIVRAVRKAPYHPGVMQKEDLFFYQVIERSPVFGTYRDYEVFGMGPPSSGGSTLLEALNILELYDMPSMGRTPAGIHIFAEAQKLAFQDRNRFIGDPAYSDVPINKLISKEFAKERAEVIRDDQAYPTTLASVRPLGLEGTHTSHMSIVDSAGNMVSYTTTIESVFGSALTVPGWGFVLNNELTDFDEIPENVKGELTPNAPEGDKRPRSSMTPTFVFKSGEPILIAGTPGGSTIIGTVLNIIVNVLDFEMSLFDAVNTPRIINRNGAVEMETPIFNDHNIKRQLSLRGHPVTLRPVIGNAQTIFFDREQGVIVGVSDPRGEGEALGY